MKKLLGLIIGVLFAMIIMPKLAKMSFAAKYRKAGVAYAAEANADRTINSCSDVGTTTSNLGQVALKIKCRAEMPAN